MLLFYPSVFIVLVFMNQPTRHNVKHKQLDIFMTVYVSILHFFSFAV